MKTVSGKEIKGYNYADGTHWYWGDKEVAVINEKRREIEWCDRTFNFPSEVVEDIRNRIPITAGSWIIEARRTQQSACGSTVSIFVNNNDMHMDFSEDYDFNSGEIQKVPDERLGEYVYACLWHDHDSVYHYSDRFKDLFKPDWRKKVC